MLISDSGFDGLVIKNELLGIEFKDIGEKTDVEVIVGSGEDWDYFVELSVNKNLFGIENLSGIPGTVGAAPVQNIGAYGEEVKNSILWVEVYDPHNGSLKQMTNAECRFGYRNSIFKSDPFKTLFITRVAFVLKTSGQPNLSYKDVAEYFGNKKNPSLSETWLRS